MKSRKSLFLFDFKKTCMFPIIVGSVFALIFLGFSIYNLDNLNEDNLLMTFDNYATTALTIYVIVVLFSVIIKTLDSKNIYKKYSVSSERIFIYT